MKKFFFLFGFSLLILKSPLFAWESDFPLFYAAVEEGYLSFQTPTTINGTRQFIAALPPTPIEGLVPAHHAESNYTRIAAGVALPCFQIEAFGLFFTDQEDHSFQDIANNVLTTFVFGLIDGSDAFGVGVITGSTERGKFINTYVYDGGGLKFSPNCTWNLWRTYLSPSLEFDYYKLQQSFTTQYSLADPTVGSFFVQSLEEFQDTNYFDLGINLSFNRRLCRFLISGTAGIYGSFAWTRFTGAQTVMFGVTGDIVIPVFAETRRYFQNFSHKFKACGEIGWQTGPLVISLVGRVENWGFFPKIDNPTIGDIRPATIRRRHTFLSSVGLSLKWVY